MQQVGLHGIEQQLVHGRHASRPAGAADSSAFLSAYKTHLEICALVKAQPLHILPDVLADEDGSFGQRLPK